MTLPIGLWVWADDSGIHWWSTYASGKIEKVRSPEISGQISHVLEQAAEDSITYALKEQETPTIYLLDSLPEVWINHAWEDRRP